jgi:hypothetical protein
MNFEFNPNSKFKTQNEILKQNKRYLKMWMDAKEKRKLRRLILPRRDSALQQRSSLVNCDTVFWGRGIR